MKKINLAVTGCMGKMGRQIIKSAKSDKSFKLVTLTENELINKRVGGIKLEQNTDAPSLDQKETLTAIDKLQEFINSYPNSEKMSDANDLVQELRIKLELKAFEIANLNSYF